MNNTDKLLRAFIEASGFEIEELRLKIKPEYMPSDGFTHEIYNTAGTVDGYFLAVDVYDYKVTKRLDEERFTFTRHMIKDLIEILGNHTVARNGHNNDDVLATINNLEAMIDE